MKEVKTETVDLIVTSPPYPMIEMWDDMFSQQNTEIGNALSNLDGNTAFHLMHHELNKVWQESYRVLKQGGFLCINIGDATRTINKNFQLYSNHSRIIHHCLELGFQNLPNIIWRKQTNAPNKFMGSGMYPPGAYVTLEHEYILIFRKGSKREFKTEIEKENRKSSGFFWEERNVWFSDIWYDLKGIGQNLHNDKLRKRSAAFPLELAYRLVNMFSIKNDIVLDPFLGTGTTTMAAITAERNSIGYEIEGCFSDLIESTLENSLAFSNRIIEDRLRRHVLFVYNKIHENNYNFKNENLVYNFPCISNQEKWILIKSLKEIKQVRNNCFKATYSDRPQKKYCNLFKKENCDDLMGIVHTLPKKVLPLF